MNDILVHHGILGMKWGVRRYQNYDGSYTQAGMRRYNKSMSEYEEANSRMKAARAADDYESYSKARGDRAIAKRHLNKDYKHLKMDKLADKGRERVSKGKNITNTNIKNGIIGSVLGSVGNYAFSKAYNEYAYGGRPEVVNALSVIGAMSYAGAVASFADSYKARKEISAYYAHNGRYKY